MRGMATIRDGMGHSSLKSDPNESCEAVLVVLCVFDFAVFQSGQARLHRPGEGAEGQWPGLSRIVAIPHVDHGRDPPPAVVPERLRQVLDVDHATTRREMGRTAAR